MKQIFFILLYPFAILYDIGSRFRNHLYNIEHKKSFQFDTNVIAVGNLSVGGTGKTPVVEYILRLLKNRKTATLSRGYGRQTKGFRIANKDDSALTLGDEPYQFYNKFSKVMVTVGEDRAMAIPQILYHQEETEVIILDDAYQHRSVIPNLNILLTEYSKPFFTDYILPAGRLREARKNANRADAVVITKCPDLISENVENRYLKSVREYTNSNIPVFFSAVSYESPKLIYGEEAKEPKCVYLFTGISNYLPFVDHVLQNYEIIGQQHFADHYKYQIKDIENIIEKFDQVSTDNAILLTTEKDMVRLLDDEFKEIFGDRPIYYIPIEVVFLQNGAVFDEMVMNSIKTKSILP